MLKNTNEVLPVKDLVNTKIASVNLGEEASQETFNTTLTKYTSVDVFNGLSSEETVDKLQAYDLVIFSIASNQINWDVLYRITELLPKTKTIGVSFIPLKGLKFNNYLFNADALLQLENRHEKWQMHAASLIFGGTSCTGKLLEDVEGRFRKGTGISVTNQIRMGYGSPAEVGLDSLFIAEKIDSIMTAGITEKAFPGAQLLVAKNNSVIFHEAFGYHTFDSLVPVGKNDLYDLASVTKITGPLPALMQLVDEGKLDLDMPFSEYWKPWKRRKDKKDLTLREILAHQAGLEPYYVFLQEIMKDGEFRRKYVRNEPSKRFPVKIYEGLYLNKKFIIKVYRIINRSEVSSEKKYKYSGLSFLIYPELIEQLTGIPYEDYVRDSIYKPLGANTLMFNPSGKYPDSLIVPTEMDEIYRKNMVKGWVHDENASLLGGVSGNAGLFGTANDVAKLMKMYQNMGEYGGKRYISEATLQEFTKVQYPENGNKRGLGFDKPLLNNASLDLAHASPAPEVSPKSFGHGGFTGTYVWADPINDLLFIFLSNRVYPTREHRNLYRLNIRPSLQQVFYLAEKERK
ncbi:serine hydrolase domain-containing protein [Galbibacter mesophilus]|uniref:serine hydrolase domain-containing protein n=1 Tax=Galbibacter mesophilus TaxID=379069 RepID=UPI001F5DBFF8|nr:serine hydrolase domain-containing protein [Galbibacter mesophilus]MCM5663736.1 beta-lactamase family protein [Galbibacter mesophilus]